MAYTVGTSYYLVWLTGNSDTDEILREVLNEYGFVLDSAHGCYYLAFDSSFEEESFLQALEDADLFDIDSNYWDYLYSTQIPKHL